MNEISSERVMPHNIEAEQQVLGALLSNNDLSFKITGKLKGDDFFDPVHRRIFEHIMERVSSDKLASPITLKADMDGDAGLKELGGPGYLARLLGGSMSSFAIIDYAQTVTEMARRRGVIQVCQDAIERVYSDEDAEVAHAELEIFLHTQEPTDEPRSTSLLAAHTDAIKEADLIRSGELTAVPSGLDTLDEAVSFMRGRYTIIGGTTSMGKTALALSIVYNAAKEGFGVGFASMEMTEIDLARRLNSIDSLIPYQHQDRPMSDAVFRKVIEAAKLQEALPIEIFNARVNDLASIVSETKKLKKKYQPNGKFKGLGLLVIDYLQLVKGKGTDFEVLSSAANDLKQVAKLLDVHVIALAQVGTKVMERDNPRPGLSDMRGSGDLGMAPDNVIFCHRPEYYLENQEKPKANDNEGWADYTADVEASKNKMELIIGKARMGKKTTVTVNCDMSTNRFWDMEPITRDMGF